MYFRQMFESVWHCSQEALMSLCLKRPPKRLKEKKLKKKKKVQSRSTTFEAPKGQNWLEQEVKNGFS